MAWRDVNATSLLVAAGIRLPWGDHMDETMTVAKRSAGKRTHPRALRLSRLADAHSANEFRDPTSAAYQQLVDIVQRLAR